MEQIHAIWVMMVNPILETLVMSDAIMAITKLEALLECAQLKGHGLVETLPVLREVSSIFYPNL